MRVLEAIREFLDGPHNAPELAARWSGAMETQVNVSAAGAQAVEGRRNTWTDGKETWYALRMPKNAATEPNCEDKEIRWSLAAHAEAVGCTGWDWQNRCSRWCGFDFDAMTGHAAGVGITAEALAAVADAARALPYVETRRSTGGAGLHLYVLLDAIPTANHTEHAALARAVLARMSADCGFDFAASVDVCGGNMWIWHRKMTPENGGLTLLNASSQTLAESDLPGWRGNLDVITRKRSRVKLEGIDDEIDELASARKPIVLDETHKATIQAIAKAGFSAIWVNDYHLLNTHTAGFAAVFDASVHKGAYSTNSPASNPGEPNCFAFPLPDGGWRINRFSKGVRESATWNHDDWTWCNFNCVTDFDTACRGAGGAAMGKGAFYFPCGADVTRALAAMGKQIDIPAAAESRSVVVKPEKDGQIRIEVRRLKGIDELDSQMKGWAPSGSAYVKFCNVETSDAVVAEDFDQLVRILITPQNEHAGTYVQNKYGSWDQHAISNAKKFLQHTGLSKDAADEALGACMNDRWELVSLPFQPEYPGGRKWNRNAAKLKVAPATRSEDVSHPHWDLILSHIGASLDEPLAVLEWAGRSNIRTGADYLRAILAAILREPFSPTPYLFFVGPENCGKSILWEAIELFASGVVRADRALTSKSEFNGELASGVFCVVEEVDLTRGGEALARIKDFVTSRMISIRKMRTDTYMQRNHSHWFHFANSLGAAPIFDGDTRITVVPVGKLTKEIPKEKLLEALKEEAPAFLRTLIDLDLPPANGRLRIPVIETSAKKSAQEENRSELEKFIETECERADAKILYKDFYDRFQAWLPMESSAYWTKPRVSQKLPSDCPRKEFAGRTLFVTNLKWRSHE